MRHRHFEEVDGGNSCFHDGSRSRPQTWMAEVVKQNSLHKGREVSVGQELGEFLPPSSKQALRDV
jgi:hypothetical protein